MAAPKIALLPFTPWTLRLFALVPLPPFWVGLAISVLWFGFYLLYSSVLGDGPGRIPMLGVNTLPSEFGWSLIIGMAPAVTAGSLLGAKRDLNDLAPLLRVEQSELDELQREIATVPVARVTATGVGMAGMLVLVMLWSDASWPTGERPGFSEPAFVWYMGRNVVNWWMISRALVIEVSLARAFSRLTARLPVLPVVDRTPLASFGRHSLRSVLLWMLYLSLFSLQYALGSAKPLLGVGVLVVACYAIAGFLLPVWAAHVRLREVKAGELAVVREQLAEARERMLQTRPGEVVGGRLADLVAWEQRVSTASEWPFSSSIALRFALYTTIGLGSWLGAAFVERVVESALGG